MFILYREYIVFLREWIDFFTHFMSVWQFTRIIFIFITCTERERTGIKDFKLCSTFPFSFCPDSPVSVLKRFQLKCLLRSVIGVQNSRQFLNQSVRRKNKTKRDLPECMHFPVLSTGCMYFLGVLIGSSRFFASVTRCQSNYFDFEEKSGWPFRHRFCI